MERTQLGTTGLEVSRLVMGAMTFGGQADRAESHRMLDLCVESGIDFVDTANMYNAGVSEEIIGDWLAARPARRREIVLASKVRYPVGDDEETVGLSPVTIRREIDRTLARLRTDHLDLYYLHAPDRKTPLADTLATMDALVRAGKVRRIGMSNYAAWQMTEALSICEREGWHKPAVVQPMYNLIAREIETEILPACTRFELATCVFNPLAGGLLTGKHDRGAPPAPGGRFATNHHYRDRYWHDAHFDAVAALAEVAGDAGCSLIGLALRWLLDRPGVSCVILGASSLAQLELNMKAMAETPPLDQATEEACDLIYRQLRGHPPRIVR